MSAAIEVCIHASQFPENVRRDLLDSLRTRRINHKFHYDTIQQTEQWLALHDAWSPARIDPDCAATYDRACQQAIGHIAAKRVHLIGLGCGGGQKDARLLRLLRDRGKTVCYSPIDVGVPMVLTACRAARSVIDAAACRPLVCDLLRATDLAGCFANQSDSGGSRLITFFGMLPNFEPQVILARLAALHRPGDGLLLSANLAPGADYGAGVQAVLAQYDNEPTRAWLLTFLLDLGVERGDGRLRFFVEDSPSGKGLKRITCEFVFTRSRELSVHGERFEFRAGETVRLFFSYRYTPKRVDACLARHGLEIADQWITRSGEEGVFLCRR